MRVVGALSALLLFPSAGAIRSRKAKSSQDGCVNFMVVGDFGSKGGDQADVAESMAAEAARVNAAAVLALGDNIYDDGAEDIDHMVSHWSDIWLRHSGNRRPWYAVLGNHDWREEESSDAMRDFTDHEDNEGGFWNVPSYWYTKRFDTPSFSVEVFAIDSQSWRGSVDSLNGGKQVGWLDNAMSNSNATWKIVMGHHPVYSAGSHGGSGTMQDELDPILRDNKASIYFCGHDHSQQHIQYKNVNYVVSGSGSKDPRDRSDDYPSGSLMEYVGEPGFAGLSVCDGSKATLKLFTANGDVEYEAELSNWNWDGESPSPSPSPSEPSPPSPSEPAPAPEPVPVPDDDSGGRRRRRRRRKSNRRRKSGRDTYKRTSGRDSYERDSEEERRIKDRRSKTSAVCNGVQLKKVDLRCSRDGCTVIPDTASDKVSCDEFCSGQGLQCTAAWKNHFEDCRTDTEIGCDELLTCGSAQICQCGA